MTATLVTFDLLYPSNTPYSVLRLLFFTERLQCVRAAFLTLEQWKRLAFNSLMAFGRLRPGLMYFPICSWKARWVLGNGVRTCDFFCALAFMEKLTKITRNVMPILIMFPPSKLLGKPVDLQNILPGSLWQRSGKYVTSPNILANYSTT